MHFRMHLTPKDDLAKSDGAAGLKGFHSKTKRAHHRRTPDRYQIIMKRLVGQEKIGVRSRGTSYSQRALREFHLGQKLIQHRAFYIGNDIRDVEIYEHDARPREILLQGLRKLRFEFDLVLQIKIIV